MFVNPGYNGTVQTVTMGQTSHIDCQVTDLRDYQVSIEYQVNIDCQVNFKI